MDHLDFRDGVVARHTTARARAGRSAHSGRPRQGWQDRGPPQGRSAGVPADRSPMSGWRSMTRYVRRSCWRTVTG